MEEIVSNQPHCCQNRPRRRAEPMCIAMLSEKYHGASSRPHAHVEGALIGIKQPTALEHSHLDQFRPQVAISSLKLNLLPRFLSGFRNEISNVKLLHGGH